MAARSAASLSTPRCFPVRYGRLVTLLPWGFYTDARGATRVPSRASVAAGRAGLLSLHIACEGALWLWPMVVSPAGVSDLLRRDVEEHRDAVLNQRFEIASFSRSSRGGSLLLGLRSSFPPCPGVGDPSSSSIPSVYLTLNPHLTRSAQRTEDVEGEYGAPEEGDGHGPGSEQAERVEAEQRPDDREVGRSVSLRTRPSAASELAPNRFDVSFDLDLFRRAADRVFVQAHFTRGSDELLMPVAVISRDLTLECAS